MSLGLESHKESEHYHDKTMSIILLFTAWRKLTCSPHHPIARRGRQSAGSQQAVSKQSADRQQEFSRQSVGKEGCRQAMGRQTDRQPAGI